MQLPENIFGRWARAWPCAAGLWLGLSLSGALFAATALAQPTTALDYQVKAAFLIKFTQYTVWPSDIFPSNNAPIIVGVAGDENWINQLKQEATGPAVARKVEVRALPTLEEATNCHVVFITGEQSRKESEWFAALKGKPILTVGESEWSIERGAVMRFIVKGGTQRFEASLPAAAANRLELSGRMLAVAAKVYRRAQGG